jgi:hypothetical protein
MWEVSTGVVNSANLTITTDNQFGAGMPNQNITMSITDNPSGSAKLTGNVWNTTIAGNAFGALALVSDSTGTATTTFSTPNPVDGDLGGVAGLSGDSVPKANNIVTATSGSASGSTIVVINRPLGSFTVSGPTSVDIGTTANYSVINAVDVDSDPVSTPSVTWSLVNTASGGNIGNTGDTSPQSVSASTINPGTGQMTAGATAGDVVVTATSVGAPVVAQNLNVSVFGAPVKVVFTPDTLAGSILGSTGIYAGAPTSSQPFTVSLIDARGHAISPALYSPFSTASSISSAAAGSITSGGVNISSFTVVFGSSDGTFTIGVAGTWTGANGGAPTGFGLTRTVGLDVP